MHKGPDEQSNDTKGCLSPCFGFVFLEDVVDEITTVWVEKSEKQLHNRRACDMAIHLIPAMLAMPRNFIVNEP